MTKEIDFTLSIKEICTQYPEVIEIMKNLGFDNITKPMMLNTAGRFMTIPKGAEMKKIDMSMIKETFETNGFTIK